MHAKQKWCMRRPCRLCLSCLLADWESAAASPDCGDWLVLCLQQNCSPPWLPQCPTSCPAKRDMQSAGSFLALGARTQKAVGEGRSGLPEGSPCGLESSSSSPGSGHRDVGPSWAVPPTPAQPGRQMPQRGKCFSKRRLLPSRGLAGGF